VNFLNKIGLIPCNFIWNNSLGDPTDTVLIQSLYIYIYIFFLVFSPGTVVLLVSSGLNAAFPSAISLTSSFLLNLFLVLFYVWVCMYYKQDTQLSVAQLLTFLYSMIMTITIVGLMVSVRILTSSRHIARTPYGVPRNTNVDFPLHFCLNI